jgi:hypothetical protein
MPSNRVDFMTIFENFFPNLLYSHFVLIRLIINTSPSIFISFHLFPHMQSEASKLIDLRCHQLQNTQLHPNCTQLHLPGKYAQEMMIWQLRLVILLIERLILQILQLFLLIFTTALKSTSPDGSLWGIPAHPAPNIGPFL